MAVGYGSGDSKKAAEQSAAYSVSQSQKPQLNDEASAELLDRIDRLNLS
jgi:hypothetical protein